MKLRLFLDEDVHAALAAALRKRGHDAVLALETKRLGLSDESQLNFATQENRALVILSACTTAGLTNAANTRASSCRNNCPSAKCCGGCSRCCKKKTAIPCADRCAFSDASRLAGVVQLV
jgi:hypothetical protein